MVLIDLKQAKRPFHLSPSPGQNSTPQTVDNQILVSVQQRRESRRLKILVGRRAPGGGERLAAGLDGVSRCRIRDSIKVLGEARQIEAEQHHDEQRAPAQNAGVVERSSLIRVRPDVHGGKARLFPSPAGMPSFLSADHLTAPAVMPRMNCFCISKNITRIGSIESTEPAATSRKLESKA